MKTVLKNVSLDGRLTDITMEGGKILSVEKTDEGGTDCAGLRAYPGLIDIHSHGCIGYDTMEGHLAEMADYECRHGITTWYPTTMTMSREDILRATDEELNIPGVANLPGFHMEGPFINVKYKGAQNEEYICAPDLAFTKQCKNIKMVTVAPEAEGSMEYIKNSDAVISIGHTDADYDTVMEAAKAGAKCLTHTYNAMPGIHHRKPGPIPAGADAGLYAQLICDGKHVHPSAVRMLIKLYGTDRVILISDSMRATGLGDGEYSFGGQPIYVKDGTALTADGHLAGSTTNLYDCVKCAISFGIPEAEAVKMASATPAALMGLNKGTLAPGYDADVILVDARFGLKCVIVGGEVLHTY